MLPACLDGVKAPADATNRKKYLHIYYRHKANRVMAHLLKWQQESQKDSKEFLSQATH